MFIFDLDNFIDLYVKFPAAYLGVILYFNWYEAYIKFLTAQLKKWRRINFIEKYIIYSEKTIRPPPGAIFTLV